LEQDFPLLKLNNGKITALNLDDFVLVYQTGSPPRSGVRLQLEALCDLIKFLHQFDRAHIKAMNEQLDQE
jgi:hypothetical protein